MGTELSKTRRMKRLEELASKANGRHDAALPLSEIAPSLEIKHRRFVDGPNRTTPSELAYDFNTLCEEGFLELIFLNYETGAAMGRIDTNPAVKITNKGLDAVAEARRWWLSKAIEKQPMTFLQVVVTVVFTIGAWIGGWAYGRYVTPIENCAGNRANGPEALGMPQK
jgi:hypothetical protein